MIDIDGIIWELESRKLGRIEFHTDDDILRFLRYFTIDESKQELKIESLEYEVESLEDKISDLEDENYDLEDKIEKLKDELNELKEADEQKS